MTETAVRVTRILKASPHQVFAAWTDAERMRQWLVPGPGVVTEAVCDPVVGGAYRFVKLTDEGAEVISGEYVAVDAPHRLVFTWLERHLGPSPTTITVTLEDRGDGTTAMTILHERLPAGGRFASLAPTVWAGLAERLERLLADGFTPA